MRAELAVRPLDVLDAQTLALACMRVGVGEDGGAQVGVVDNLGAIDADSLEDLFASEDGMGPLTVDIKGSYVQASLVCGVQRVAGSNAAASEWSLVMMDG